MHQMQKHICPKKPDPLQMRRTTAKIHHRTAESTQQYEPPQLSLSPLQQKQDGRDPHRQAEAAVQHRREPRKPQTERPQQIIHQTHRNSQQDGLQKQNQLLGDPDLHTQPNRRPRKPLRACPSSS